MYDEGQPGNIQILDEEHFCSLTNWIIDWKKEIVKALHKICFLWICVRSLRLEAPELRRHKMNVFSLLFSESLCKKNDKKNIVQEINALWCHRGHWYISKMSDSTPSQVFDCLMIPTKIDFLFFLLDKYIQTKRWAEKFLMCPLNVFGKHFLGLTPAFQSHYSLMKNLGWGQFLFVAGRKSLVSVTTRFYLEPSEDSESHGATHQNVFLWCFLMDLFKDRQMDLPGWLHFSISHHRSQ